MCRRVVLAGFGSGEGKGSNVSTTGYNSRLGGNGVAEEGTSQITRVFEQPPDTLSFYSDYAQIIGTGHEVLLQFYETIPGPPSLPGGQVTVVRTRLRVTAVVSQAHAANIGRLLLQRVGEAAPAAVPAGQEGTPPGQPGGGSVS